MSIQGISSQANSMTTCLLSGNSNQTTTSSSTSSSQSVSSNPVDTYEPRDPSTLPQMPPGYADFLKSEKKQAEMTMFALQYSSNSSSSLQNAQSALDLNHDGVVSKDETTTGLSQLQQQVHAQPENNSLIDTYNASQTLSQNFNGIAGLDGQAGISKADVAQLGTGNVTGLNMMQITNPGAYNAIISQYNYFENLNV